MTKGIVIAIGIGIGLLALAGSSNAAPQPPPPPIKPPLPPFPSKKPPAGNLGFFNWATNKPSDAPPFLNWGPGQTPEPSVPPARTATLPKAGERWQVTYSVNRGLSVFEKGAAASAFRSAMPGQTLDSLVQSSSAPWTVTLVTTYNTDATAPIPIGSTIQKSDIVATLTNARKIA